jgi:hypothetical protein
MNAKLVPLCNGSGRNLGCFFCRKKSENYKVAYKE